MSGNITLTKAALVNVLDGVLYPNPDDPGDPNNPWGPYGPIGPIAGPDPDLWRFLAAVLLNPQPLPPVAGPWPIHWRYGPGPQPWFSAFLARTVIDQAVAQYRFTDVVTGTEQSERTTAAIGSRIREFVDDYCGTRPPGWPRPWPWPPKFDPAQLRPLDLLIAGAQFQKAADFAPNNPLQSEFTAAADQLFETGLKRLESCSA